MTSPSRKPFFKLDSIPRAIMESLPKPKSPNYDLLQKTSKQIEAIDKKKAFACIDKTCQQKVDNTSSSEEEEEAVTSSNNSDEVIATIQRLSNKKSLSKTPTKKSLLLLTKYKIGETLGLGIVILDLLLQISNTKKEANSLIETTMVDLSMFGTLTANQSTKCCLPSKKWE